MGLYEEYYCLAHRPAAEKREREHRRLLKHAAEHRQQNTKLSLRGRITHGLGALLHIIESQQQELPCANGSVQTEITGEHS